MAIPAEIHDELDRLRQAHPQLRSQSDEMLLERLQQQPEMELTGAVDDTAMEYISAHTCKSIP